MEYLTKSSGKNQNTQKKADLHVHTNLSDSTFSPQEVIDCAVGKKISAIAITDHDCTDGIEPAISCAAARGIEVIPGIEFTCEWKNIEVHILGYFIDYKADWLQQRLKQICQDRIRRMDKMIKCLSGFGIDVDMDEVMELSGPGSVGRLHLAQVLLKNKNVASIKEAFEKYIGSNKPCYIRGHRISPFEAIELICAAGGTSVLAHPHVMGNDGFIPDLIKAGLKGIEVYHSDQPDAVAGHYKKLAEELGLLITGGSDCHGLGKGRVLMGEVTVPYDVVERLRGAGLHSEPR